ncbi:four-helix bundle copper-binding protein [Glycocaulis sp.]|uniref:four-helix bundle copper-binding protein n=1 Tax=Glycocaulis sp. TaxID=1969725 RepID=UPI003D24A232
MITLSDDVKDCIAICTRCAQTCLGEAMTHCLEKGGDHVAPAHFRHMIACAEMCRAAAAIMLTGAGHHASVCRVCAEICEACARDCEQLEGMEDCAATCRECAESCREMAQ